MKTRIFALCALLVLTAGSSSASALLCVFGDNAASTPTVPLFSDTGVCSSTGALFRSGSGTGSAGFVSGSVRADWGSLGGAVSATGTAGEPGVAVYALMDDIWTIGGAAFGTPGRIDIAVSLDGSLSFNGSANLGTWIGVDYPGGNPAQVVSQGCTKFGSCRPLSDPGAFSLSGTRTLSFQFGSPFHVILALEVNAGAVGSTQSVNAMNTAQITGFQAFDTTDPNNPVLVSGATVLADSGHDYSSAAGVPEPGTLALSAVAVACLAMAARRSSRRPRGAFGASRR
ncbi:MAG: hypothetical protein LAP87_29725 [Acidobacteriia bacterium]|nr:hypothetical protein [Terriglobia bacterium]